VGQKFEGSWQLARKELGTANVHRSLQNFYTALYHPDAFQEPNQGSETFAAELSEPLPSQPSKIPNEEAFIEDIKRTLVFDVNHPEVVYDSAFDGLKSLMQRGHVIIWTSGDHEGFPEQGAPGSYYQFQKIAASGLAKVRREVAEATGKPRLELLNVLAADEKFEDFPSVLESLVEKGVDKAVILDDQVKNLVKAEAIANQLGISILPVWVQQGQHGHKVSEGQNEGSMAEKYNAVSSVVEAADVIDKLLKPSESVEFLIDYDGVLSDDLKRYALQNEAVIARLKQKGWI